MIKGLIMDVGNGASANVTFLYKGYEISLANDTSCKTDGEIRRSSICIFKDDVNVTDKFFGCNELYGADASSVHDAFNKIEARTE